MLTDRKVNPAVKDKKGWNAFHYACSKMNKQMAENLFNDFKFDINAEDNFGQRAIGLAIKGIKVQNLRGLLHENSLVNFLFRNGAKTNFLFKEKWPKRLLETDKDVKNDEEEYKTTPLIHAVSNLPLSPLNPQDSTLIQTLIQMGSSVGEQDSLGRDAFMISIEKNDELSLSLLLQHIKSNDVKKNQDKNKRSALHYCVWTFDFGSFENEKILEMLLSHKFDATLKDKNGATPIELSLLQDSGKMLSVFKKHSYPIPSQAPFQRNVSMIPSNSWESSNFNFEEDC